MIIKTIILILLLLVILSLAAGMLTLIKDRKESRTAKFLTIRIALSVSLFVLLIVSFFMGWIQPHGIMPPAG